MNAIIIDDDELSGKLMQQFIEQIGFIDLQRIFFSPISALTFLSSNKTDLILLDIEMPEMSGLEFMSALKSGDHQIILVTSHKEFALEAYEQNVAGYLVKPVSYAQFFKTISSVMKRVKGNMENQTDDIVFVKKDNRIVQIRKSEILWVEALGDYAVLNTAKEKFILHSTLKAVGEKLPPQNYIRVHRSFIVRIDKIEKIEDNTIFFNDKTFPIGKSYHDAVFGKLKMF